MTTAYVCLGAWLGLNVYVGVRLSLLLWRGFR